MKQVMPDGREWYDVLRSSGGVPVLRGKRLKPVDVVRLTGVTPGAIVFRMKRHGCTYAEAFNAPKDIGRKEFAPYLEEVRRWRAAQEAPKTPPKANGETKPLLAGLLRPEPAPAPQRLDIHVSAFEGQGRAMLAEQQAVRQLLARIQETLQSIDETSQALLDYLTGPKNGENHEEDRRGP